MKHLSERVKSHEKYEKHVNSSVKYTEFGTANILNQTNTAHHMYSAARRSGAHEPDFQGHDERESSSDRGFFF